MQKLLHRSKGTLAKRIPPFKENDGFFSQSHFKWLPQPHKVMKTARKSNISYFPETLLVGMWKLDALVQ